MIDERMEELAGLYVLGALEGQELREFEQALRDHAELPDLVAKLSVSVEALAGSVPLVEPPPQLRAKILAQVAPKQKTISLPERRAGFWSWIPWGFATALAVICLLLLTVDNQLRQTVSVQTQRINGLTELTASLESTTNQLTQLALSLQSDTNDLRQTVLALQETNRLVNLKIAMLNSLLADAPKTVAVTLWDDAKQDGVFVVQNLKPLPADKDYQLWVLENGTIPVDAGVIHVDKNGSGRAEFKAKQPIKVAGRFAVTEEVHGGAASPNTKNMVLASN